MADSSETLLSPTELREQLGLDDLSGAEAHEEFSERLNDFLEQKGIKESEIISGESAYAPILSEAAFNGLDFRGMEGTGLSLSDAHRMINDKDYRLEMAEDYLTGNAEERIEKEYTEYTYNPYSREGVPRAKPLSEEGMEAVNEAIKIKEFMHYEMRDTLNSGPKGLPTTLDEFNKSRSRDQWEPMLGDQAAFHQNGEATDLKFIHPDDGRELVFDGDTGKIMTSGDHVDENGVTYNNDEFMGTYNYVNATIPEDLTPGPLEAFLNTRTEGSLLHRKYDVDTWIELGNTRAERYANGGEEGRQTKFDDAVKEGIGNSIGNTIDETQENISDKVDKAGEAINDSYQNVKDALDGIKDLGSGLWQEGAINPNHQGMNAASIQQASVSETDTPTASGTVYLEDAIGMLAADQKTLNTSSADGQVSPIQDALNHPDAAQMFQNLQSHGVKTLTAEITPDMSAEDRASELLLAGQEATQEAGISMPAEQRQLEATLEQSNSFEEDYSYGM